MRLSLKEQLATSRDTPHRNRFDDPAGSHDANSRESALIPVKPLRKHTTAYGKETTSIMTMLWATGLAVAGLLSAAISQAQDYPNRPIRMIIPLAAGGAMDTVARAVSVKLTEQLGQTVVVDNRGGGGGTIGVELVAAAVPDGYTLIMVSATSVIRPLLYSARYDLSRDFAPISQVTAQPYLLTVHPSIPATTVKEFVAHAKANPGKLNYASAGQGSIIQLATELFSSYTGTRMVHVPFKGIGAALPDLVAGNIQVVFASIITAQPHVRAGRLRGIAVTGPQRSKSSPEFPTIAEAGVKGYAVTNWYGVQAPAKTPRVIIERLHKEVVLAVQHPDVMKRFAADGADAVDSTPREFAAHIKAEHEKWSKVIKETGIKGD
jgi:tripartite-type tricarboxylate transporter receptor subunit TctC